MFTPFEVFDHLRETLAAYLETAYKLSDAAAYAERGSLLREGGLAPTVAQVPYIESTPAFPPGPTLEALMPTLSRVPRQLFELAAFGMPVAAYPLYEHQARALQQAFGPTPNLLVATGTASGKTEIFLLCLLAEILREALSWPAPIRDAEPGAYNSSQQVWLHRRRHERRPPAVRAIILYPMNALVNDQLQRIRRALASDAAQAWQRRILHGNLLYFGMYTGDTQPTGHWTSEWRRRGWTEYLRGVSDTWSHLAPAHQARGNWPRPDGPEMLCRWDMQAAPPDILVTNYSMLEYMLVRPIESQIFDLTATWLRTTPGARLTLVVDEAHTYTGSRGTEIAHLLRRLKERFDITSGDGRLRCIATSASLPISGTTLQDITRFASQLFDEPEASFYVVTANSAGPVPVHTANPNELRAFADFAASFSTVDPVPAIEELATNLHLGALDHSVSPAIGLYQLLRDHPLVVRCRGLTARNATQLDELASTLWGTLGDESARRLATTGVVAAGAFARETDLEDALPLISSRVHMMFRGVSGVWACMDPNCTAVPPAFRPPQTPTRIVGRLYLEPMPWCTCGARVLEVFTCRVCGLMFLGGIPDSHERSLWPWTSDLETGRPDLRDFEIFGIEPHDAQAQPIHRSVRSTLRVAAPHPDARPTYEVRGATVAGIQIPFPYECPRCHNRRQPGLDGREIVEPLRTKGSKSLSVLVEDAFRLQPPAHRNGTANAGRKALVFSDSRQEAAMLAGDLEFDHNRDLVRQMVYRILNSCERCLGFGRLPPPPQPPTAIGPAPMPQPCGHCNGTGRVRPAPIPVAELRDRVIRLFERSRINPTFDDLPGYFAQLLPFYNPLRSQAINYVSAALRNEIAAPDFSLEPMGLATWRATFPEGVAGPLPSLTSSETDELIDGVTRLLATEDVLLPTTLEPRDWVDLVRPWERRLLAAPGSPANDSLLLFTTTGRGKLARYIGAIADALLRAGRLDGNAVDQWTSDIAVPLFQTLQWLGIVTHDVNNIGFGINIDRFQLEPVADHVHICRECRYVANRAVLNVCLRCGQATELVPSAAVRNFYRRVVDFAVPGRPYPDPFPLRVLEHTAQIEKPMARRYELRFQNVFVDGDNPDDARIDALSVTTTMEMGIDIGDLLSVGLRNVPPTVANYQQRAGRAGRRGSAVATVLTFAQPRSHDQYYFTNPPRIISDPPRVPRLHPDNRVIAQRHVRAVVLQRFFHQWGPTASGVSGLLNAWGTVGAFSRNNGTADLETWVRSNRLPLEDRCRRVVGQLLHSDVQNWVTAVPAEVARHVATRGSGEDLLRSLLETGYLPRHAFPIDVVSLWTEQPPIGATLFERGVQRDLGIALSEFAPGAEVVRNKRVYRVVSLYDPFMYNPSYQPEGQFFECRECQAVQLLPMATPPPPQCTECGSHALFMMPWLRPPGFASEWAGADARGRRYLGGGRERAGTTASARLAIGEDALTSPNAYAPNFAPVLRVLVRVGDLYLVNRGADPSAPGFRICPDCGRRLGPQEEMHTYAADIPPFYGNQRGPVAGRTCPNRQPSQNRVLLGHRFPSEVVQLGVELPMSLDADNRRGQAAGRAVWLSFGTLVANAAARALQVNPEELAVGVRSVRRPGNRVHGEVFLYDMLPGGAGHARDINANLGAILSQALTDGRHCTNTHCAGACYRCLLDYQNQVYHPLLDRSVGTAMLEFIMHGRQPHLAPQEADRAASHLQPYIPSSWTTLGPQTIAGQHVSAVFERPPGERIGILVRHALQAQHDATNLQQLLIAGVRPYSVTDFDLVRRPFWVMNQLAI